RLVRVRHRCDDNSGRRVKTVEPIVEEHSGPGRGAQAAPQRSRSGGRIGRDEAGPRAAVKRAGGIGRPRLLLRELSRDAVSAPGLHGRVVSEKPERARGGVV
ncbi:MAG: hypothetical protein WBM28_17960, partial [Burkholderiales bacterium]